MNKQIGPRRSAGMRGSPLNPVPEQRPVSTTPPVLKKQPEATPPRLSKAPKPKVLMGEVAAPRGQEIGRQRDAFRTFMLSHHLQPTQWARKAGVAPGEVLAFLTGKVRFLAPETASKLAAAAGTSAEEMFG